MSSRKRILSVAKELNLVVLSLEYSRPRYRGLEEGGWEISTNRGDYASFDVDDLIKYMRARMSPHLYQE